MTGLELTAARDLRAVLLAFGLIVAGLIVQQLMSVLLAVLIVIVIALPLSAFATALSYSRRPSSPGAVLGLLLGASSSPP